MASDDVLISLVIRVPLACALKWSRLNVYSDSHKLTRLRTQADIYQVTSLELKFSLQKMDHIVSSLLSL